MRPAVSPGFSSSEDAGDFVKTCFSRKMWAAVRLQWINGGGDIQPGSELSEWQVRKQSVSWGSLSGIGWNWMEAQGSG